MQIFYELNKNDNLSLALGFFDGVHLGHKKVIKSAVDYAKKHSKKSAVITFKDHPCCYFWGVSPKYILTQKMREEKIKELGVDFLYELNFEEVSNLTAEEYLKNILVKHFSPVSISTGWNHNFGRNKTGNSEFLKENSLEFGYEYSEISPQKLDDVVISSSEIRNLLSNGYIEKANKMLGYRFSVSGKVVEGNQIGRTIGFRTANIKYPKELIDLPYGVFSVLTNYGKGIANFGMRPTVNGKEPILEVHILDFDKDIYGKDINVEFEYMIREEKKFPSLEALKKQIELDINSPSSNRHL